VAKQSGMGDALFVAGVDLSGDTQSLGSIGGGPAVIDVTAINKSAYERIGGRRDGRIEWTSYFNDATGAAHPTLKGLPTTDVHLMYCRGTTLANPGAALVAKQINYDGTRADDGAFTFALQAQANGYGLEWGKQLTAGKRTDTGATSGTGVDFGTGSTTFGAQFYLQVFSFTGTDVTIRVQESSDNGAGDAWANVTGGAFTAVTAGPTTERIATASGQTVERYLRVTTSTTGGFSELTFAVLAVRNDTAVVF
jgi:hypothetical protein